MVWKCHAMCGKLMYEMALSKNEKLGKYPSKMIGCRELN